jgi:hypothetical protein
MCDEAGSPGRKDAGERYHCCKRSRLRGVVLVIAVHAHEEVDLASDSGSPDLFSIKAVGSQILNHHICAIGLMAHLESISRK